MRVAIVYPKIYPYVVGGIQKRNHDIAKLLTQKYGLEMHLIGLKFWKGERIINIDGVIYHGIGKYSPDYTKLNYKIFSLKDNFLFSVGLLVHLFILPYKFDIIEVSASPLIPPLACKLYCMLKRVRLIIIWYEVWLSLWFEMFGPLLGALGRLLELFVSRISRNVTAISLSIRMRLRSLGVSRMPIKVIYPPIDLKRIIGVNPASFLTDITFVGRLFSYKNIDIILNALIELRDKGMNLRCLIIGEGPQENALRDKVKRNNLEEWVVFKYFAKEVNEVYSYLKSSKILAFPSRREGFGVICIEAQACGLPVIGLRSRFNADEELILDGFNGFVLDKDDCNELAGKIRLLIENERLRERFSANAFQFSQKFDQDISVEELFDYFKEIMER